MIIFLLKSLPTVNGAMFFKDTEDKAISLRSQTLPEMPTNIRVYFAFCQHRGVGLFRTSVTT
jgi:hypothetical protein